MSHLHFEYNGQTFGFHELLYKNLKLLKKANKNDWDFKFLISGNGMTRTGKSTLGCQIACILDPSVTIDRVVFRGDKLVEESIKIGKHKALIYDEAKEGLDSKKAMQGYSQKLTDYFSECGWMNQYLIVILPEFFDLNKTVALNQSICLINCKTKNGFSRGYFDFYSRKDKRYLYIKGKKYNNYQCQKPTFDGTFTKFFPFNVEEYEKRKLENQRSGKKELKDKLKPMMLKEPMYKMYNEMGMAQTEIGKLFGFSQQIVHYTIKEYTNNKEQLDI